MQYCFEKTKHFFYIDVYEINRYSNCIKQIQDSLFK